LQTRSGKNGRPFTLIKLRTMVANAEAGTGAVWTQPNDPRITRVGRILRKTHIDEFPQLLNVLLGQMSLVGPRPERPEFVNEFEWTLPHYRERLNVRPGITGFAQLELPPDTDLDSVRKKLGYDLFYIRNASPWFDARILCFTASLFFKTFWVAAWKRIRMPGAEHVEAGIADVVNTESSEAAETQDCV
jgi:lipopolysaccharide/colanic/teichoic acid biosynthesis glycosyltransferase